MRDQRVCRRAEVGEHQTPKAAGAGHPKPSPREAGEACQSPKGTQREPGRTVQGQREQVLKEHR